MCGPCQAAANILANSNRSSEYVPRANREIDPDCQLTLDVLLSWRNIIRCIKTTNKFEILGLSLPQLNSIAGYIQSAINYPDDYCYYSSQLLDFKEIFLPLIISNVSECIQ
jgi:hypothetical protein